MKEKMPKLKVQMLGGFSLTWGEKPMSFSRNSTTKAMKLLQILLYHSEQGIAREKLIEFMFGREAMADAANSLRVTVHRMKKMILDMGMPDYNYVKINRGIYQWDTPMETEVDVHQFNHLISLAKAEKQKEKEIKLLEEACGMYTGEFLPGSSEEDWILIESVQYKKKYTDALKRLCNYLWEKGEYEEILKYCEKACELYPFDEWQSAKIDCYMAMNRYKEAISEYEETAKLFFEELGITPSEKMIQQLQKMGENIKCKPQTIREIKGRLMEDDKKGAFYSTLPSFRDNCRLIRRISERNGAPAYVMLCSLIDSRGYPMKNGPKLTAMAEELYQSIKYCLRSGDSFTRYSPSQFLILLVGSNKENCGIIFERIENYFSRQHKSWKNNLEYYVTSVNDVDEEHVNDTKILFNNNDTQ